MIRLRQLVQRSRDYRPASKTLFSWTGTTLLFWLIVLGDASWTFAWWEERPYVVVPLVGLMFITVYLWLCRVIRGQPEDAQGRRVADRSPTAPEISYPIMQGFAFRAGDRLLGPTEATRVRVTARVARTARLGHDLAFVVVGRVSTGVGDDDEHFVESAMLLAAEEIATPDTVRGVLALMQTVHDRLVERYPTGSTE